MLYWVEQLTSTHLLSIKNTHLHNLIKYLNIADSIRISVYHGWNSESWFVWVDHLHGEGGDIVLHQKKKPHFLQFYTLAMHI